MRDRNYAGYEAHKADHERMLEELSLKMESFERGTCEDCGASLGDCLAEWYTGHATEIDARLKDLVQ